METAIATDEVEIINRFFSLAHELSDKEQMVFYRFVASLHPEIIVFIIEHHDLFKNFIMNEHQRISDSLDPLIISSLNEKGYIGKVIESLSQSEIVSPFKQLISAYLQSSLELPTVLASTQSVNHLNLACELGSFHALAMRAELAISLLNTVDSDELRAALTQQIINDANRLADLYSTVGYIEAAKIHQMLLQLHLSGHLAADESASHDKEQIIIDYLCADMLLTHPKTSLSANDLMKSIVRSPLFYIELDGKRFSRWSAIRQQLFKGYTTEQQHELHAKAMARLTANHHL